MQLQLEMPDRTDQRRQRRQRARWHGEVFVDTDGKAWATVITDAGHALPKCLGLAEELSEEQGEKYGWGKRRR